MNKFTDVTDRNKMAHMRFTEYSIWLAETSDNIPFHIWLFAIRIYKVLSVSISIIVSLWLYPKENKKFVLTNTSTIALH